MTQEEKDKIIHKLTEKGAQHPCPRCGHKSFTLLDGYFSHPLQANISDLVLGGISVPSVVVVCTNCGFLSQHALGSLGLLPPKSSEPKQ